MRRKVIQFGTNLLETTGINIQREKDAHAQHNVWRFIISFCLTSLANLSCCMVSITNIDSFYQFVVPIPYIAGITVLQSGIYFIYHYREIIGEMFYEMDNYLYIYPDEHLLKIDYVWYLQEENITTLMTIAKIALFGSLFLISLPMLGELVYFGRIKTFISPQWSPWPIDNLRAEVVVFLLQSTEGFCGIWLNYVTMVFLIVVIIEFMRQYQRLEAAVSSLKSRTLEQALDGGGGFDRKLRENIVHCIRHHQVLYKNFQLFEMWFSVFFSIELAISTITFTFALYIAMNAQSTGQILNYFTLVLFIWMNFLVRCLISEIFSHLNDRLAETVLWEAPWFMTNKENKKLLIMFHSYASKPLQLFGLSIFEATRVTFGNLIRKTYSFFNVLNRKN